MVREATTTTTTKDKNVLTSRTGYQLEEYKLL